VKTRRLWGIQRTEKEKNPSADRPLGRDRKGKRSRNEPPGAWKNQNRSEEVLCQRGEYSSAHGGKRAKKATKERAMEDIDGFGERHRGRGSRGGD